MSYTKECNLWCPEYGYCNNRNDKECAGFIPMNNDGLEEETDPMEEKLERSTY